MYVPNSVSLFGNAEIMLTTRGKARDSSAGEWVAQYAYLDIKKTRRKYLNRPSLPCTKSLNPNVTACIIEYIQEKVGCSANIQGIQTSHAPPCKTRHQFKEYVYMLSKQLQYADDAKVYDMTGCLSSCEKDNKKLMIQKQDTIRMLSLANFKGSYHL